jgi:hypothetical protein
MNAAIEFDRVEELARGVSAEPVGWCCIGHLAPLFGGSVSFEGEPSQHGRSSNHVTVGNRIGQTALILMGKKADSASGLCL